MRWLEQLRSQWEQTHTGPVRAVTGEDVAEIVSLWTGIPVAAHDRERERAAAAAWRHRCTAASSDRRRLCMAVSNADPPQRASASATRTGPSAAFLFLGPDRRGQNGALPRAG